MVWTHILVHDDVIKWKHFPRYWPFVRGIHRSPVNSPHKGQWCGALILPLICAWISRWVNNRKAGDLRRHRAHYDVSLWHRNEKARRKVRIWYFLDDTIVYWWVYTRMRGIWRVLTVLKIDCYHHITTLWGNGKVDEIFITVCTGNCFNMIIIWQISVR